MFLDGAFLQLSGGVPGARALAKPEIRAVFGSRALWTVLGSYLVSALAANFSRFRRRTAPARAPLRPALCLGLHYTCHLLPYTALPLHIGNAPNLNDSRMPMISLMYWPILDSLFSRVLFLLSAFRRQQCLQNAFPGKWTTEKGLRYYLTPFLTKLIGG